jgi:CHAD domain-containing protein
MAKASLVPGLRPKADLASNTRRILLCRLSDLLEWLPRVFEEEDRRGLHDCRIAVKRVRYALEFLGSALPLDADRKRFLSAAVDLQEALGAVTDCDAHLRRLDAVTGALGESQSAGLTTLLEHAEAERHARYQSARDLLREQLAECVWPDLLRTLVEP